MNPDVIEKRFKTIAPFLNERQRRLFTSAEAMAIGYGGIIIVAKATGISRRTIIRGIKELQEQSGEVQYFWRIRKKGGGRKPAILKDTKLISDLENLIEPVTLGDPESSLRWTSKSVRNLARNLNCMGHKVSYVVVSQLLHKMEYSLQANQKIKEGKSHPDRDKQFEYIGQKIKEYQVIGQPVISVDAKKKNWLVILKTLAKNYVPKETQKKFAYTTLLFLNLAEQLLMEYMT